MKNIPYFFLITICLFTSCEYDPQGNNFIELTPPDEFIAVEISLNDIDPSDTIYVFQDTRFSIKINAKNKELRQAKVLLDDQVYNLWGNPFEFVIRLNEVREGVHQLTVNAVFASGSGSLAEMMGLEGYMGELSWNVRVIPNYESIFKVNYRTNEEGFLEIYWNNSISEHAIEKYAVYVNYSDKENIINDPMQKSFVDYGYVCGNGGSYGVRTYLKSGYSYTRGFWLDKPVPKFHFEEIGLDQLRVYWDKPFANGRFDLIEDNTTISSGLTDTTITLPQSFGRYRQFGLEIRPKKTEYDSYHNRFNVFGSFHQGGVLNLSNCPEYAYCAIDNIIYSTRYDNLVAIDATSLKEKVHVMINGLLSGGKIACAPHNSTVAAMTGEETWIFSDSRFVNPIIIPGVSGDFTIRLSALTSDDRFFVVYRYTNDCQVFDVKTGNKIIDFQFKYKTIFDMNSFVTVSEDGRYFCASSINGMEVFEINGTNANVIFTDTRQYWGAMFIPSQPDKLMFRVNSDIEIRKLPDFSLIQKFDVAAMGAVLCHIDPVTGYLLYYQDGYLKVAEINNISNPLFKLRSNETTCILLNNKILTRGQGGLTFDISPYVNH